MPSLYELTNDMLDLEAKLIEAEGNAADENVEAALMEWAGSLEDQVDQKVEAYCNLIDEFEARAKVRAEAAAQMKHRATVDKNAARALKDRLLTALETMQITRMETELRRVTVANNGGQQPIDIDLERVPAEFQYQPPKEVDMALVREALKASDEAGMDGLSWARFMPRGKHIRIK
tara:strand:- start:356 stop:883 length:528 start_codon:yes stop_codon:yes gene_type:complete